MCIKVLWNFFFFIFKGVELDLTQCLKTITLLLQQLNTQALSEADQIKLLNMVEPGFSSSKTTLSSGWTKPVENKFLSASLPLLSEC